MQALLSRRRFLATGTLSAVLPWMGVGTGGAAEPIKRPGSSRLLLSLAAYSFRDFFRETNRKGNPPREIAKPIDLFEFVDFCADHGCAGAELTSYYFPKEPTTEFLIQLRRRAFLRGVAVSGTAVGNNFTFPAGPQRDSEIAHVKKWIDHAALLGAPHIRIFAGNPPKDTRLEDAQKQCISAIEECAAYAGEKGIFLGLENHGGIVAEPRGLLTIVQAVKSPWLGINLDTANFNTEDPYHDLALCAPYAVNVQMKAEIHRRGAKQEPADLKRLVQILREANYQGYVALEYESAEDPWVAVPRLLAEMKSLF